MKKNLYYLICLLGLCVLNTNYATAQFNRDRTVLVTATVSENPSSVTLHFPPFADATKLQVYRKTKEARSWGNLYASLAVTDSTYKDTAIHVGEAYEYLVYKEGGSTGALGYIYAGINHNAADLHGAIALVVDETYTAPLADDIKQLELDLIGDGWQVVKLIVKRTDNVTSIRNRIKVINNVKAVFLVGNVPVPYSGSINPDGHPDHKGAWACDGYYAELDDDWTDVALNISTASRPENRNIPGDGKFDVSTFFSDADLMTGRVDMTKLPAFTGETDTSLLKYYLWKNHSYRFGNLTAPTRALIDDNFQSYTIASSNWRNFGAMVGVENIKDNVNNGVDYYDDLKKDWYLWSGACGGGSYNSCAGVINSNQFAADSIKTIFTSLAGSYFGDWDVQDNLLRSAIASKPSILASFWGGIPNWALHHMALGECIGYGALLTQNEDGSVYEGNFNQSQRLIHTALMGDPTLRMHTALPAKTLNADSTGVKRVTVSWAPSTDSDIVGYHVYRATHLYGQFGRASQSIVTGTTYVDADPFQGHNVYMVRAVKKTTTPSGTYYNYSQGIFDSTDITYPLSVAPLTNAPLQLVVYPNPGHNQITLQATLPVIELTATLTNVLGQTVKSFAIENNETSVDVSTLPTGIYFIHAEGNGYKGTTKFVKE